MWSDLQLVNLHRQNKILPNLVIMKNAKKKKNGKKFWYCFFYYVYLFFIVFSS